MRMQIRHISLFPSTPFSPYFQLVLIDIHIPGQIPCLDTLALALLLENQLFLTTPNCELAVLPAATSFPSTTSSPPDRALPLGDEALDKVAREGDEDRLELAQALPVGVG